MINKTHIFSKDKIPTSYKSQIGAAANYLLNENWLIDQYVNQNKSTRQIAKLIGCGKKAVNTALRRFNISLGNIKTKGDRQAILLKNFERQTPSSAHNKVNNKEWIYNQFIIQNKSIKEIAAELGIQKHSVTTWLHNFNIKKDLVDKLICSRRRYKDIYGYDIGSPQACEKRIKGHQKLTIQTNKAGLIGCDSSWERDVVIILDNHKNVVSFTKETTKLDYIFGNKMRLYYVDFTINVNGNTLLVEVKADRLLMNDDRTKLKINALKEYCNKMSYKYIVVGGKNKVNTLELIQYLNNQI